MEYFKIPGVDKPLPRMELSLDLSKDLRKYIRAMHSTTSNIIYFDFNTLKSRFIAVLGENNKMTSTSVRFCDSEMPVYIYVDFNSYTGFAKFYYVHPNISDKVEYYSGARNFMELYKKLGF